MICDIGKKFAEFRKQLGYTQLEVARLMGEMGCSVSNNTVSHWEKEINSPNAKQFITLCALYNISNPVKAFGTEFSPTLMGALNDEGKLKALAYIQDLIDTKKYAVDMTDNVLSFPVRELPSYNMPASAGTGQFLDSSDYEMVPVGDDVPLSANFGVRVAGDSMEPRYYDGDTVWVKQGAELNHGEVGVFHLNGQAFLKVLHRNKKGISLVSLNKAYSTIRVGEEDSFRVFGKVVGRTGEGE